MLYMTDNEEATSENRDFDWGLEEKDTEIGWDEMLHTQRDRDGMTHEKPL